MSVSIDESGRRRSDGCTHIEGLLGTEIQVVTASSREDGHDHSWGSRPAATVEIGLWTAVLEFTRRDTGEPFVLQKVQALMSALDEWNPSGVWDPDRYAIQLDVPARDPHQALALAIANHRQAARSAGLPSIAPVRAEILTLDEFERYLRQFDPTCPSVAVPSRNHLLSDDLYYATRRLHGATTPKELTDAVNRFVTSVGGRVEPLEPRHLSDTIDTDVSIERDQTLRATADTLSVAGLIIEQSLPVLLSDARCALARLKKNKPTGISPHPSTAADR